MITSYERDDWFLWLILDTPFISPGRSKHNSNIFDTPWYTPNETSGTCWICSWLSRSAEGINPSESWRNNIYIFIIITSIIIYYYYLFLLLFIIIIIYLFIYLFIYLLLFLFIIIIIILISYIDNISMWKTCHFYIMCQTGFLRDFPSG
jgi:hypothetical protein